MTQNARVIDATTTALHYLITQKPHTSHGYARTHSTTPVTAKLYDPLTVSLEIRGDLVIPPIQEIVVRKIDDHLEMSTR